MLQGAHSISRDCRGRRDHSCIERAYPHAQQYYVLLFELTFEYGGLNPIVIALVDEGGAGRAADASQPVLQVVAESIAAPAHGAVGDVAVAVVHIAVAAGAGHRPAPTLKLSRPPTIG